MTSSAATAATTRFRRRWPRQDLGGSGDDRIDAADRVGDVVSGGPGREAARTDPVDKTSSIEVSCNERAPPTDHRVRSVRLAALLAVAAVAQPGIDAARRKPHAPLRAVFYLTAPVRTSGLAVRPAGRYARMTPEPSSATSRACVGPRGRGDHALGTPGSPADRKLVSRARDDRLDPRARARRGPAEQVAGQRGAPDRRAGRWACNVSRVPAHRLATRGVRGAANRALRDCTVALRWRAAARRLLAGPGDLPGVRTCHSAADAWFRDEPNARSAKATGTYLIRPGFWPSGAKAATLARSPDGWEVPSRR